MAWEMCGNVRAVLDGAGQWRLLACQRVLGLYSCSFVDVMGWGKGEDHVQRHGWRGHRPCRRDQLDDRVQLAHLPADRQDIPHRGNGIQVPAARSATAPA
eukprot:2841465-Pyramimonas_sp.AAC.1